MPTIYRVEDETGWGPYGWGEEHSPDHWPEERKKALFGENEDGPICRLDDGIVPKTGVCADGFKRRTALYDVEKPAQKAGKWHIAHTLASITGDLKFGFADLKQLWDWFHPVKDALVATGFKVVAYEVPEKWLLYGECQVGYLKPFAKKVEELPIHEVL